MTVIPSYFAGVRKDAEGAHPPTEPQVYQIGTPDPIIESMTTA